MIIDPRLIDLLESYGAGACNERAWRHVFEGRDPLLPTHAGGRWAPAGQFGVLYTSLTREGAIAEGNHLIAQYSIAPSRPRLVFELDVRLERVADLTSDTRLKQLGVDKENYAKDWGKCPEIGAAANFLGYQGILVPNARTNVGNLIILHDQLGAQCLLEVKSTHRLKTK